MRRARRSSASTWKCRSPSCGSGLRPSDRSSLRAFQPLPPAKTGRTPNVNLCPFSAHTTETELWRPTGASLTPADSRGAQPARLLPRGARLARALRIAPAPRAHPSSRTARRRSLDVTPLMGRPVTLANGDCADLATGVTAYTRPSCRRIWTSPSREACSSTSARRCRAVEYVYSFIDSAPRGTSPASCHEVVGGAAVRVATIPAIRATPCQYIPASLRAQSPMGSRLEAGNGVENCQGGNLLTTKSSEA